MNRRTYCRCETVRNFTYDEAAERLGCKKSWLAENISRLPHQKLGAAAVFCNCELALIQALFSVVPNQVRELLDTQTKAAAVASPGLTIANIRPSGARQRRSAAS